jgi:thiol-disulfide isomerase/thioredoxin
VIGQRGLWFFVLGVVATGLGYTVFSQRNAPKPDAPVADVRSDAFWSATLPDLANRPQPMKQWLGKVAVVNFWAPWCPPCREEIPGFLRLQDRLGGQGLQMVGVALDEADKVQAYVDETGIGYPILLGGMQAVELGQAAGNRLGGLPYTVVFDRQGNAVATLVGGVTEDRLEALVKPLL